MLGNSAWIINQVISFLVRPRTFQQPLVIIFKPKYCIKYSEHNQCIICLKKCAYILFVNDDQTNDREIIWRKAFVPYKPK